IILICFVLVLFIIILSFIIYLIFFTIVLHFNFLLIVGNINFSEWIEFSFYIIISVILTYIFYYFVVKNNWRCQNILFYVSLGNMLIGLLIYPITLLSDRTPPLFSIFALNFWLVAHLIYGISMSLLFILIQNK